MKGRFPRFVVAATNTGRAVRLTYSLSRVCKDPDVKLRAVLSLTRCCAGRVAYDHSESVL